jgi:hypothetical protein
VRCLNTIILSNVLHIPTSRLNLISGFQLDEAGFAARLGNGLVTLSPQEQGIVDGVLYNDMYQLNMSIVRTITATGSRVRSEGGGGVGG